MQNVKETKKAPAKTTTKESNPCWKGYHPEGTKPSKVNPDKNVPNCTPNVKKKK